MRARASHCVACSLARLCVVQVLAKEHKAHVDGLKYEAPTVTAAPEASEPKSELYTETQVKVDEVLTTATNTLDALRASRSNTRTIGTLLKQLGGTIDKAAPIKLTASEKAKAALSAGPIRGEQRDDGTYNDEIEERTGYSTQLNNANLATMTRAAIG